jgi:hypothetical protein
MSLRYAGRSFEARPRPNAKASNLVEADRQLIPAPSCEQCCGAEMMSLALSPLPSERRLSPRKRASRRLRHLVRKWISHREMRRLMLLSDAFAGQRCFLLGSGPSLAEMDLSPLANERVCLVNMGIKALDQGLPHATFHVITDNNRYRRFASECELYGRRYGIRNRFYPFSCRKVWEALPVKYERPYFLLSNPASFRKRGMVSDPRDGYSGGSTVLLSALQLLFFLGFREVYILGCDLDYESNGTYFYALDAKDRLHEADPAVIARRRDMLVANEQFGVARRFYEDAGRILANAGHLGNLTALPRVKFEDLFEALRAH